jgi:transcriptional regulator with XRE-family HTH domain
MIGECPADQPAPTFAVLLKQLRAEARLTQEELAHAAGLSPRSISDLERGISRTARKDTALLLADALAIEGSARTKFVAAARGRAEAGEVLAARDAMPAELPAIAIRIWLIRLTAQSGTETASAGPEAQTIAVRDSVGGAVWRNARPLATVRSDPAFTKPGRCRHTQSRRGTR